MNPAITAALIAASHEEKIEQKVIGRLKSSRSNSRSTAIALELDEAGQKLLEEAIGQGTVTKTPDGRYYLNERAIADRKEGQGFLALVIILISLSFIASGFALIGAFDR